MNKKSRNYLSHAEIASAWEFLKKNGVPPQAQTIGQAAEILSEQLGFTITVGNMRSFLTGLGLTIKPKPPKSADEVRDERIKALADAVWHLFEQLELLVPAAIKDMMEDTE